MIGKLLSFCIKDIIEGRVALEDVEYIISGTKFATYSEFENVLATYASTYWKANPIRGLEVATKLMQEGRILQPRVIGGPAPRYEGERWYVVRIHSTPAPEPNRNGLAHLTHNLRG